MDEDQASDLVASLRNDLAARVARKVKEKDDLRLGCEEANGVSHDHSRAARLFQLAWEYGQPDEQAVEDYYTDMADLIKQ